MEVSVENSKLFEDQKLEECSSSLNGDDSNAMVMPGSKKNKRKRTDQEKLKDEKKHKPRLSNSQKRKLKKLEEEKEKELLLSKSMEMLKKHKIPEDAYALLQSSHSIGQVETMRQKRWRAVQFSKVGLELKQSDTPVNKKAVDIEDCAIEPEESVILQREDFASPTTLPREVVNGTSVSLNSLKEPVCHNEPCTIGGSVVTGLKNSTPVAEEKREASPSLCSDDSRKVTTSADRENESPAVNISRTSTLTDRLTQNALTTPTVVHVSRPNEIENNRKDLPIVMMEQEIMEAINDHSAVIICGETGCGKTTQVPQFLYEAGFGSNLSSAKSGIIGVTQPRRVAVLATARRVAYELGVHLGREVGFQVRHDKRIGKNCSIKFMTDGILLREVQNDFLLKRYSVLILDEAHERSLNTDILIGMLSRVIRLRQDLYEKQQKMICSGQSVSPENMIFPLKLVLMSATLRVEDFVSGRRLFHDPPPVIEVPTRQFPVTVHFSKRTEIVDYIGQAYKKIMSIHKRLPQGGILVFVTGQREVEYLCKKLHKASKELVASTSKRKVTNESTISSETNSTDGIDMKEISEACEINGDSADHQTDRFSSIDEDQYEFDEESDDSYDSESESDLEFTGDDEDSKDSKTLGDDGNLLNKLGGEEGLTSLKAAFEALSGKRALHSDSQEKQSTPVTQEDSIHQSASGSRKIKGEGNGFCAGALRVLPLYAMLPAAAQLHVFDEVKEGERLVVVATNVAETSLTIPGIKYVVDTGREKVKNYNSSNGMEMYEIQWISKASAAQRAGRAGRTGPGHCYRLYSSAVFCNTLPDFSCAEISKIPVDGVVLLMKSIGIDKVANFPFPTPPEATALVEAERCLKALEALDANGRLTPLGKAMAHYPMSPRHSRMLLTVIQIMKKVKNYARANLVLGYAVAAAAALSLSNPFIMMLEGSKYNKNDLEEDERSDRKEIVDKQEKLRKKKLKQAVGASRAKFYNPCSDALTIAYALQCFELSEHPAEFCNDTAMHVKTMEEMSKLRKQLLQLVFNQSGLCGSEQDFSWTHGAVDDVEQAWRVLSDKHPLLLNEEEVLGQAICAGWADRVAKRIRGTSGLSDGDRKANAVRYQACAVKETVFLHRRSSLSRSAPEFLVYTELLHTKRPYMHGATTVKSDWLVKYARSLCTFSAPLTDPKPYYEPQTDQVFSWVVPTFGPHLWELPLHNLPITDSMHRVAVFAYALLDGHVLPCLRRVRKFMAAPPSTILRPEAAGQKRVGNLLSKLKKSSIDSSAKLRHVWTENPKALYTEILDWFQEIFHDQFDELWSKMRSEVSLEPHERLPKRTKREKRKK